MSAYLALAEALKTDRENQYSLNNFWLLRMQQALATVHNQI